jgi:hypothetical protein
MDPEIEWARERLKGLNVAADVVAMVRAREAGDEDLHGALMAPYMESAALMLVLHLYTEAFCRTALGALRKVPGFDVDNWLERFALTIASEGGLPQNPLGD